MAKANFQAASALREHMLEGHRVSLLEAICFLGFRAQTRVCAPKKDGFIVKSQKVPMAKIIRRVNEYTVCKCRTICHTPKLYV